MPFHLPRHQHTLSDPESLQDSYYSHNSNAFYPPNQTLSSVPQSEGHWNDQQQHLQQSPHFPVSSQHPSIPTTSSDQAQTRPYQPLPNSNPGTNGTGNGTVIPFRLAPSQYQDQTPAQYSTPSSSLRRSLTTARQPEELHLNTPSRSSAMSDVHHYGAPPAYAGDQGLSIKIEPSTPQHPSSVASNPVPGTLQPGLANRPAALAASNTAPALPTLPQLSTSLQQPPHSARPSTLSHSHSYSRSSPGVMDQPKYKPFSNTPEQAKYSSPTAGYISNTPLGPSSYSPLGLADIRARGDQVFSDLPFNPTLPQDNETSQYPQNSHYAAPWPIYAVDWCKWPPRSNNNTAGKIAIGSYLEDNHNYIQILDAQKSQIDPDNPHADRGLDFVKTAEATHAYPVTRILWEPPSSNKQTTDLLATSGDHLRLWSLPNDPHSYQSNNINRSNNTKSPPLQKLSPLALLSNSKSPEHTAPITSLDWNVVQPSLIITSSIDTTCTIWDIPSLTAKTQLIAHDKEVYDVRFCANSVDVFVSCGADGSVRMFDLRSLEHSTIIYEPSEKQQAKDSSDALSSSPTRGGPSSLPFPPPLLRIAASPHDAHLLATFSQDSSVIRVLDVRQPGQALLELKGHGAAVSCIDWSSSQRGVLASGADDCCVLLWDLMGSSATGIGASAPAGASQATASTGQAPGSTSQERGPSAVWESAFEVANISWAPSMGMLGVCGGKGFWGVQL
ncbi:hypothetical protein PV10_02062 [Exophiala mesophila]|uniref:Anaphase-promoting complex subunit 4 WD40 domain-containing protein n=1 Tax=Exophiala mesophila TaxID=212818 RepID=A0A0D1WXU8_EXOME|nr:uncharacterized protein PV10_02062 [Exophiala mesophila]KIV94280.1 hypothetical protein PV10_02062 [Exophiala mesophila]